MNILAGNIWYFPFEIDFIIWLQNLGAGTFFQTFLQAINNFFSLLGEETIMIAIMGIVFWGLDKERGKRIGGTLIVATVVNPLIKNAVKRLRPWQSTDKITLQREVGGYSFPSGHSSSSATIYSTLAYEYKDKNYKWLTAICIALPLLVAFSRNYLGAHFITDVVCGLLLGYGIFIGMEWALRRISNPYILYYSILAVSLIGFFYCDSHDFYNSYGLLLGFTTGTQFEDKFVKFKNTKVWWKVLLRTAVGGVIYLGLNELIKLIFKGVFVEDSTADLIFRTLRYALNVFILVGVYPLVFKPFDKLIKNEN